MRNRLEPPTFQPRRIERPVLNWGDDATVVKPHESAKAVREAAESI